MKVTLLGTGTPNPSLKRASSGYLVEHGEQKILLDLGPGAYHRMMEAGTEAAEISDLLFSHLHYDHCLDYPRLVLTRWDQGHGNIPELNVRGPAPIAQMTERLFGAQGAFRPDIDARIHHPASVLTYELRGGKPPRSDPAPAVKEVEPGESFDIGDLRVTCVEVPHVQPWLTCLAYRLDDSEGNSITYSGDSGPCPELEELARGTDLLIHMCHQISGSELPNEWTRNACGHKEVAEAGMRAGAKAVAVTHIPRQMDVPGLRERLIAEMSEIYSGHIYWGEDLMEIDLTGPAMRSHDG